MSAKVFIFIGPPGAGKGTLATLCADTFNWVQVSTGNLCRKHIAEQTEIGKEIDLIIKSGKLIDDNLITCMVTEWFEENVRKTDGIILDGYPRTEAQAASFNRLVNDQVPTLNMYVVLFTISDELVVDRLCNRLICQNKNCQIAYSLTDTLSLAPKQDMVCDKCLGMLGRRADDSRETVIKRLEVYHKHAQQLIQFYRSIGQKIIEIDAAQSPEKVFEDFVRTINA